MKPPSGTLVQPEWVADNLNTIRLVDVRDAWEYDEIGHIPGAVNIPFDSFRSSDGADEGMLPGTEAFRTILETAGIQPNDILVAYDDEHGVFAARFLVTADLYGHKHRYLLNGDYSAWTSQYETTTETPTIQQSTYPITIPDDRPLITADEIRSSINDETTMILDTRTSEEFQEGHIEGAINFDWRDLVDQETRGIKPKAELKELLGSYGLTPSKRVILYCNTARRISHTYIVLRDLGYENLAFYEGSLTDWQQRGYPLEVT